MRGAHDATVIRFFFGEIDEKGNLQTRGTKIRADLRVVRFSKVLDRLQFNDYFIVDQEIEPMSANWLPLVSDDNLGLGRETQSLLLQFDRQGTLIDLLGEAGTENAVHDDDCLDDLMRERILARGALLPLIPPHPHIPHFF